MLACKMGRMGSGDASAEMNCLQQKELQKEYLTPASAARKEPKASATARKQAAATTGAFTQSGTWQGTGTQGTKRERDDLNGTRRPEIKLNIPEQICSPLLRILATLPTMITQSTLDAESTDIVWNYVNE
ncbi:hypothetical protein B0H14DRAFT_2575519 [Mycena olivaceomarginata]|nr:hypothetical protein B0H14DRAFT_2575519 [Mycena olivaceomarginata]